MPALPHAGPPSGKSISLDPDTATGGRGGVETKGGKGEAMDDPRHAVVFGRRRGASAQRCAAGGAEKPNAAAERMSRIHREIH